MIEIIDRQRSDFGHHRDVSPSRNRCLRGEIMNGWLIRYTTNAQCQRHSRRHGGIAIWKRAVASSAIDGSIRRCIDDCLMRMKNIELRQERRTGLAFRGQVEMRHVSRTYTHCRQGSRRYFSSRHFGYLLTLPSMS